jgi:hypothetical protein
VSEYPKNKLTISQVSAIQLIADHDTIISMPSGVINYGVFLKKNVIEYFDYPKLNRKLKQKYAEIPKSAFGGLGSLDENGEITSIYRKYGLVKTANNKTELKASIKNPDNIVMEENYGKLRNIYPDGACQKITDIILNFLEKK